MTLPASGAISFNNINVELGASGTTQADINQSSYRTLAGVPSGTISMSNFYGKSNSLTGVSYVVLGGGGCGVYGGGGAGGMLTVTGQTLNPGSYPVTVGAGMPYAANPGGSNLTAPGSSFNGTSVTGGGSGGANNHTAAGSGGSGGGAPSQSLRTGQIGSGIPGQGNPGGTSFNGGKAGQGGGGGGGAGGSGASTGSNSGGTGGAGQADGITGTTRGAGGGGDPGGSGGSGWSASPGYGSGGNGRGGSGVSGVVIIKYPMSAGAKSGGTVTNDGTYYYNTFTSSGTFTV